MSAPDVTCSACRRSVSECIGEGLCEAAKRGARNLEKTPRALSPYGTRPTGHDDYRAEALSRDPQLTCSVERMCGSFAPAYVIRNRHGHQVWHHPAEAAAWAGACGATRNSAFDPSLGVQGTSARQ